MINISKNNFYTAKASPIFTVDIANKTREFHKKIENYKPTALVSLPNLAKKLGNKNR